MDPRLLTSERSERAMYFIYKSQNQFIELTQRKAHVFGQKSTVSVFATINFRAPGIKLLNCV